VSRKNILKLFSFILIFFSILAFFQITNAQIDVGVAEIDNEIALGTDDPRAIGARIINIAMLFLSAIAVVIMLAGGFKWMTSDGDEKKVEDAKKLLRNGAIGLVIILASWGIARFVLNKLVDATGNGSQSGCVSGAPCGCSGVWDCSSGFGTCVGSNCGFANLEKCTTSGGNGCQDGSCQDGYTCDSNCFCVPPAGLGESCDADPGTAVCDKDESKCGPALTCSESDCTCQGAPMINEISPVGGYCESAPDSPCVSDTDCASGICNLSNPNGASGNLLSVYGYNFGDYDAASSKILFVNPAGETLAGTPGAPCVSNWTSEQVIISVPSGLNGSYQLKIVRSDGQSDMTNDANGPQVPDFIANNIVRPGLCSLDPAEGQKGDFYYYGVNLTGVKSYFGSYEAAVSSKGTDLVTDNKVGKSIIPDIVSGKTTFFVTKMAAAVPLKSNYLKFRKVGEETLTRFISGFTPDKGPVGQYVTIRGKGFGRIQGKSTVKFVLKGSNPMSETDANFDFPEVCADAIWSEDQIIVKVPSGLADNSSYYLDIVFAGGEERLSTKDLTPPNNSEFIFKANDPLNPGLCKMFPIKGQVGTSVALWGEYFGSGANGTTKFYSEQAVSAAITTEGQGKNKSQKMAPNVPGGAASGPVVVVNNGNSSNPFNFSVGACKTDGECGVDNICCQEGSYKKGSCVASESDCAGSTKKSVFEWRFDTNYYNLTDQYSCNGWAKAVGTCQTGKSCPNSPGQCSPFNLTTKVDKGVCCTSGVYNNVLDKCVDDTQSPCNLSIWEKDINSFRVCTKSANNEYHWVVNSAGYPAINPPQDAGTGWINLGNNKYRDNKNGTSCISCADGFECAAFNTSGSVGVCAKPVDCPGGSSCDATDNKCYESPSCQCCCRVEQAAQDCCAGLTCGGACGSDTNPAKDKNSGLGKCTGCKTPGGNQADWDAACNCSGHSGQYCEVGDPEFPEGYCADCDILSSNNGLCASHASCCIDGASGGACRGVNVSGGRVSENSTDTYYGYCSYYDCDQANPSQCGLNTPLAYGLYENTEVCGQACQDNPGSSHCAAISVENDCLMDASCCWDFSNNVCKGEERIETGADIGYCAYYTCPDCSSANKTGSYLSQDKCQTSCSPGGVGMTCSNLTASGCNAFACPQPFGCFLENGGVGGAGASDCGACCCQVGAATDVCAGINTGEPNLKLQCEADQAPCSGAGRGLCCGCSEDEHCGGSDNVACDINSCCRTRPEVKTASTTPAELAENVCRNALIKVTFNQAMDVNSFTGNVLLLEERAPGSSCPSGTFLADNSLLEQPKSKNFLARILDKVFYVGRNISRVFSRQTSLAAFTNPGNNNDKVYCSIPGLVSNEKSASDTLIFSPQKLLNPNTVYYIVVKGDQFLHSDSGVLSYWATGLNGAGLNLGGGTTIEGQDISFNKINYVNSYISVFRTMSSQGADAGICTVDHVQVSPSSYLFQTTNNDLNENDSDSTNSSFDSKRDSDKAFSAYALSKDGQYLNPLSEYDWDWIWGVDDADVVDQVAGINWGTAENKTLLRAKTGVTDDSTSVTAEVDMKSVITAGDGAIGSAPVYVFVCENPWPSVPASGIWSPWLDDSNCDAGGACNNFNYKFYYCRDSGQPGTADDLPAINEDPVTRGQNSALICSVGGEPCPTGANSGDACGSYGQCIFNVLKESYFFRAAKPKIVTIVSATDKKIGGTVELQWRSIRAVDQSTSVSTYKIYYGISGASQSNKRVLASDNCVESGLDYVCIYTITGLSDKQLYSFRITALTNKNQESELSDPAEVTPTDMRPPLVPLGFGAGG